MGKTDCYLAVKTYPSGVLSTHYVRNIWAHIGVPFGVHMGPYVGPSRASLLFVPFRGPHKVDPSMGPTIDPPRGSMVGPWRGRNMPEGPDKKGPPLGGQK